MECILRFRVRALAAVQRFSVMPTVDLVGRAFHCWPVEIGSAGGDRNFKDFGRRLSYTTWGCVGRLGCLGLVPDKRRSRLVTTRAQDIMPVTMMMVMIVKTAMTTTPDAIMLLEAVVGSRWVQGHDDVDERMDMCGAQHFGWV